MEATQIDPNAIGNIQKVDPEVSAITVKFKGDERLFIRLTCNTQEVVWGVQVPHGLSLVQAEAAQQLEHKLAVFPQGERE